MAGNTLTAQSSLQCPHGGLVQIIPASPRASAGGAPIATAADGFVISGCPFQIPAVVPIPSPCVTIQWLVTDLAVTSGGAPTLSLSSVGLCMSALQVPQGPVVINGTQPQVSST